jgi:hypothetical protein
MSKIDKIGLAILFLALVAGIGFVAKDGNLAALGSATTGPGGLSGKIILGEDSDKEIKANIDRLDQMREMYETTQDEDLKAELKPLILNAASSVPDAKLSAGMKRFLANLKKEK